MVFVSVLGNVLCPAGGAGEEGGRTTEGEQRGGGDLCLPSEGSGPADRPWKQRPRLPQQEVSRRKLSEGIIRHNAASRPKHTDQYHIKGVSRLASYCNA